MTTNTNVPATVQCYWIIKRNGVVFDEQSTDFVTITKNMDDCFMYTRFNNTAIRFYELFIDYLIDSVWFKPHVVDRDGDCLCVMAKDLNYANVNLHFIDLDTDTQISLCLASLKLYPDNICSVPQKILDTTRFKTELAKMNSAKPPPIAN